MTSVLLLVPLALAAAKEPAPGLNAGGPAPGHSAHGEVFDEGPRQGAYKMAGTGTVRFPITTSSDQAREFFEQGVGQLHGFWYFEAERSFRQAAALDPDCAIAFWGMAMANLENEARAKAFADAAVKRKAKASRREQLYIDGAAEYLKSGAKATKADRLKFIKSYEKVLEEHPDDIEAKALLACFLWQSSQRDVPIPSHQAVDALLDQVFDAVPDHPAHHYRIHLWDKENAARALGAAARCGPSAPGIAHMWHMSGHIYAQRHRYSDSAWQQEASARVDHAYMNRDRIMPYAIHNYAHNSEWLIRNLSHLGRVREAVSIAKNMIEVPRHPKLNSIDRSSSVAGFGRERLLDVLCRFERWEELIALSRSSYLDPIDPSSSAEISRRRAIGRAFFALGDKKSGAEVLGDLESRDKRSAGADRSKGADKQTGGGSEKNARDKAASSKTASATKPAVGQAQVATKAKPKTTQDDDAERRKGPSPETALRAAIAELRGWKALAEGKHDEGLALLEKDKDLPKSALARAQLAAGKRDKAVETIAKAVQDGPQQVEPLATQAWILLAAGKRDDARKVFESLRATAGEADLELRCLRRLEGFAKDLGWPAGGRAPGSPAKDLGPRPPLDSLGPALWSPTHAPEWNLPTARGEILSLSSYRGRPLVVLFYLGRGCPHCVEQVESFAQAAADFEKAGMEIVAISTDSTSDIAGPHSTSIRPIPFPLVSDASLAVFRAYRCHDDFEKTPLHGTFLIDGAGRVRWQDVGPEPFLQARFLLGEAGRLLKTTGETIAGSEED